MNKTGTAVILCGGKSSRMGFDKSKIEIEGKYLIELIAKKLETIFDEVVLVAEKKDKFKKLKYTVLEDLKKEYGPAGGMYTGLKYANSKYVFFMACDMPIVNLEYIKYMMKIAEESDCDCVLPRNGKWIEPMYAFYSKDLIKDFEKGIDNNNLLLYDIIKSSRIHYIPEEVTRSYSKDLEMFVNLNYVKDLEILKKIY
ncbi:molybdenum cofactor guanylyltransferase [Clostridium sp. P21]|uniref:Probable molybdenum cofactor guanylyltransferase n=1 Tax=Clostridium muellerianum TaxID=2716538 RepID=A0A7Y0EJY6_9CLOT|nr:molybdenum cofactor guanylyltransferase [Clostridium muellerianum]